MSNVQFMDGGSIPVKASQLTLDTGLSYALVPPQDIEDITRNLGATYNMTCKKEGNLDLDMYSCACNKEQYGKLKPMQLNIANKFFTLPVDAWMSFDASREN